MPSFLTYVRMCFKKSIREIPKKTIAATRHITLQKQTQPP